MFFLFYLFLPLANGVFVYTQRIHFFFSDKIHGSPLKIRYNGIFQNKKVHFTQIQNNTSCRKTCFSES